MNIVFTSAVIPNVAGPVAIRDPALRLAEYLAALSRWNVIAESLRAQMVVVETTGYGARRLASEACVSNPVCWDFEATSIQRAAGKGAVEASCVDSVLTNRLDPEDIFVKVTGRLIADNGLRVLAAISDSTSIHIRMTYGRPWADTRLFAMSGRTWTQWFAAAAMSSSDRDGVYLERQIGCSSLTALANGVRVSPFTERLRWRGSSGSTGASYRPLRWSPRERVLGLAERGVLAAVRRKQL